MNLKNETDNPRQRRGIRTLRELHLVRRWVTMPDPNESLWEDAVRSGAPETPLTAPRGQPRKIWESERMFRDVPVHAGKVDVQLMYFGGTQHEYHDLEAYMKDNFVTSAHPRHCFALAQQYPDIRAILCEKSKNQFCSIALPRAFPVANASAPNSLFHIHFGEGGARAELVEMWRTTQSWEWFVFLPKQEVIDHPAEFKAAHKVAA